MKRCQGRCGEDQPLDAFGPDTRRRDGCDPRCRKCRAADQRQKNGASDAHRVSQRKYARTHKDQINKKQRRWVAAHKDQVRESDAKYKVRRRLGIDPDLAPPEIWAAYREQTKKGMRLL